MGNYYMKIKNETPDYYSYCYRYHPEWEGIRKHGILAPYEEHHNGQREILTTVYVRYGQESAHACRNYPMLERYYNGIQNPRFCIRPIGDKIRLCCSLGGHEPYCDNLGQRMRDAEAAERRRQEEERRRREEQERIRREEEQRRKERIERERRIQEQISEESEALKNKLGRASAKRRLATSLTGREQQHQRTHVLAQTVEDDAEGIKYEEVKLIATKFQNLLKAHKIDMKSPPDSSLDVGEQLQMLFDQLISRYCTETGLGIWFHASFDEATQFNACSLTDKLEIVNALLCVILKDEHAVLVDEIKKDVQLHEKHALLIRLMASLRDTNRAVSTKLMGHCLDSFVGLSDVNKDFIKTIVYNKLWTPLEAIVLLLRTKKTPQKDLSMFLHTVQTYGVKICEAIVAIKSPDRMKSLMGFIEAEGDKLLETVIEEMRQNQIPETILEKVQKVVEYVVSGLPACDGLGLSDHIQKGIKDLKNIDFKNANVAELGKILIGLSVAVKEVMGYFPRITQLVSVVTLLLSKASDQNGCLLEISTGEGKSCIIAILAVILALRGSSVDIVTSSSVLAIRDVEEWDDFFAKFNLTARAAVPVGLSKCKNPDEMDAFIASIYKADIVYGTVGNFAADILRQEFEKKNVRGNRGFEAVIVDEVDFMTLDNGVQVTYLSHAASGMRHVEQVLASIWNTVCGCRPIIDAESGDGFWFTKVQHFHKALISATVGSETNENFNAWEVIRQAVNLGYIASDDLENLALYESQITNVSTDDTTKENAQKLIDKIMSKIDVPEERDIFTIVEAALEDVAIECYRLNEGQVELFGPKGIKSGKVRMLLLEKGLASELLTEEELVQYVKTAINEKLKYSHEHSMPTQTEKAGDGIIYIPQFLKSYVQNRLDIFIKNALKAILMTKGREYTIDRSSADDTKDSQPHYFDCFIPVDFKASGVLEKNKRWGDGLQQFLEMKHQLALTPLSTVTNFLSNFHYFKRYTKGSGVYGASGTLGDESSCAFLTKHFKVSCYRIPTHKQKKLIELPMIQVEGGEESWIKCICQRTKAAISAKDWCKGQAALVVCEDMSTAEKLQTALTDRVCGPDKVTMYTRSDRHSIEDMDFGPGHIIIATTLGGRGTDVSVTKEVNESGGLFVLISHFSSNRRVEKQIIGRTARKGHPGTVQMVLNRNSLTPAYQGQKIDTMRQLREDYESQRISEMETDELLTIDIREELFKVFCQRLSDVTSVYQALEKQDWSSLIVRDLPKLLEMLDSSQRFDCKPAQNALKETWAHWLILNEHRIENNEDVNQLIKDLESALEKKQSELGQGMSTNLYDHTRQALGRMYLHEADHNKECGTLTAWNKAIDADNAYRAIAVYNKAYIIINMSKDGYMDEAINLLKETMKYVDVHVAENANTLMACHFSSVNANFEPHFAGETNFKRQLEIRKSFFKMWLDYTDKAIKTLEKLKDDGEDAITEEKGIFALIEKPSHLEANELQELFSEGLQVVYEVKKKPRFCISALICAIIGVLQVFAGALVCVLSVGTASQIGMGLISEGVSDMISGVIGMIQGTFDWAEWAISKAIGIGLSLISAGFSKIKDVACAVAKGVKGLVTGAKSLSSVADDCLKAAKSIWASTKTAVSSAFSKESLKKIMTLTSKEAAKANMKQAAKYAVKEVVTQGVIKAMDVGISKGTEALFEKLLSERFHEEVRRGLKESNAMDGCLTRLVVCFGVPHATLNAENPNAYKISSSNETIIQREIKDICERVVPELITDNAVINEVFSKIKDVKDEMKGILDSLDKSGKLFTAATVVTEFGAHTAKFVTVIQNIPTKKVIDEKVVPEFKEEIEQIFTEEDVPNYTEDARSNFSTVLNLKDKLFDTMTDKIASAFTDACSSNLSSFLTDVARSKLNEKVTDALNKKLRKDESKEFFEKQQEQYKAGQSKSKIDTETSVSGEDLKQLTSQVQSIVDPLKAPSIVEVKALAESRQLGGKGLEIQTVDQDGTELLSVAFNESGSDIQTLSVKLRIVQEDIQPKGEESTRGVRESSPWLGRFYLVGDDGQTKTELSVGKDTSLFDAVAMAAYPDLSPDELKLKTSLMRTEVRDEILKNPEKYISLHQRLKEYEASYGESAVFSLPPKLSPSPQGAEKGAESVVDNSFSLTRMKVAIQEKASEIMTKLVTGDKEFLMDIIKVTAATIKSIATPIGSESGSTTEDEEDPAKIPVIPGSAVPVRKKLLYIPSQDVLQKCRRKMNTQFSQMSQFWSKGDFVSMVIPWECDDQIIASVKGNAYGVSDKTKLYQVYETLMAKCLSGSSSGCNPTRLLKLAMICSNPDATLDILTKTGLLKKELPESEGTHLVQPEVQEGKEIPEDQDVRLGKTLLLQPGTGRRMIGPWGLSDESLDAYFKICYFIVLSKYKTNNCIEESAYEQLVAWVDGDGFLDSQGQEYTDVVNAINTIQ